MFNDEELKNLTLKQKIYLLSYAIFSNLSLFVLAYFIKTLLFTTILYCAYLVVNFYLEKTKKKEHAKTLTQCFILSNILFMFCSLIMKYSLNIQNELSSIILGIILIVFSALTLGNVFYSPFKAKGEPSNYQKLFDYIKINRTCEKLKYWENVTKEEDKLKFMVYKYIFKDKITWANTQSELEISQQKLAEITKIIYSELKWHLML